MGMTKEATPLAAGAQIEDYVIERVLERDRYGYTYLAQDVKRNEVAIREFLPHEFAERFGGAVRPRDQDDRNSLRFWLRAFLEKSSQVSRLVHPSLPRALRQFEAEGAAFVVAEFHPGETLQSLLDRDGTLAEGPLKRVLLGVLGALEAAHGAGLLHRDLCPQHIWLRASDGSPQLQGFGVLRAPIRLKSRTVSGAALAPYAAPEDEAASGAQIPATDIYALGVIAYRALSGVLPPSSLERRQGATLTQIAEAAAVPCSATLAQAVDWALQLAPENRPQTAAVWRDALRGEEAQDAPVVAPPTAPTPAPRRGLPGWALPAGAVTALLVLGYALFPRSEKPTPAPASAAAPAATTAGAGSIAAPPAGGAPAAGDGASSLDRLALDLIARDKKAQDARELQRLQEQRASEGAARKREQDLKPAPGAVPPQVTVPPPAAPAPDTEAVTRERALEAEVARLRAESESKQRADEEAARAREQAAKDAAAKLADAERTKQSQAIALARRNCKVPAMDLSEGNNLNFYNAISVPGAQKVGSGAIRLPPIELNDGTKAVYDITPDSCAQRVK